MASCTHAKPVLGYMITKGDTFMIRSWLARHASVFEKLGVLDGSSIGSEDAAWIQNSCTPYPNVVYGHESAFNLTRINDQTTREAAFTLLGMSKEQLVGRWLFSVHPDEFWLQDPRELAARMDAETPSSNVLVPLILMAWPDTGDATTILKHAHTEHGHETFPVIHGIRHLDPVYKWYENRAVKWQQNTAWGANMGRHIPFHGQIDSRNGDKRSKRFAFFVHFKLHDFSANGTSLSRGRLAFSKSGFNTGMFRNKKHGHYWTNMTETVEEAWFGYYIKSGRKSAVLQDYLKALCSRILVNHSDTAPCAVDWDEESSFPLVPGRCSAKEWPGAQAEAARDARCEHGFRC